MGEISSGGHSKTCMSSATQHNAIARLRCSVNMACCTAVGSCCTSNLGEGRLGASKNFDFPESCLNGCCHLA
jgi:hypothetical protein